MSNAAPGRLHAVNVSDGGVPKLPRAACRVRSGGLEGDRQRDLEHHGGLGRAVSLYSLEVIEALRAEGHPIAPGTAGENFTLAGIAWNQIEAGVRLQVGEVQIEITADAPPCNNINGSFSDGRSKRIAQKVHPGWSRYYARVLTEGVVQPGDPVHILKDIPVNTGSARDRRP